MTIKRAILYIFIPLALAGCGDAAEIQSPTAPLISSVLPDEFWGVMAWDQTPQGGIPSLWPKVSSVGLIMIKFTLVEKDQYVLEGTFEYDKDVFQCERKGQDDYCIVEDGQNGQITGTAWVENGTILHVSPHWGMLADGGPAWPLEQVHIWIDGMDLGVQAQAWAESTLLASGFIVETSDVDTSVGFTINLENGVFADQINDFPGVDVYMTSFKGKNEMGTGSGNFALYKERPETALDIKRQRQKTQS